MTRKNVASFPQEVKDLFTQNKDMLKELLQESVQEILEAQMSDLLNAESYERTEGRRGYRAGYYRRHLNTCVGMIELRVLQDRDGQFSTEVFERYQRSEKALVCSMMEMYVQGVSTRKVSRITEELCGVGFSAATVSSLAASLDGRLEKFARRRLEEEYPYLILDARYEKVRIDGTVQSQAVLIALGVGWDGRREVLAVELADRESASIWKDFLDGLAGRGLHGVEFVVSDDHCGIRKAVRDALPRAAWQRCYVHFLRNALDHLPRKADPDCLVELRWLYDRRNAAEARRDLAAWLAKWQSKYPKLCDWVEENIEETFTFYRLPASHHKHLKSTNMLEHLNQELKRRTHIVRIFPNEASCLRLVRALAEEIHEEWLEAVRYLDMDVLKEHRKLLLLKGMAPVSDTIA